MYVFPRAKPPFNVLVNQNLSTVGGHGSSIKVYQTVSNVLLMTINGKNVKVANMYPVFTEISFQFCFMCLVQC